MRCLLLTFDCLPRRWLGCYGSLDSTTRGFDRLAAAGTTFENAVSTDVRSEAKTTAGFQWIPEGNRPHTLAAGRPLSFPSFHLASHDQPVPKLTGRRRPESKLSHELHQASTWMRDQNGPSLAWVRHPGLQLASDPISQDHVPLLLEQQALIDDELDAFLDEWVDCADERWTFVLTASRGVLRARDSARRRSDPAPSISDDLARVPLFILESRGESFGRRQLQLLPTTALAATIPAVNGSSSESLAAHLERLDPARFVPIQGDDGAIAVRTSDWLFVRSNEPDREAGEGLLFRKPEDVSDVFDVRSVQADEAIRLDALIGA